MYAPLTKKRNNDSVSLHGPAITNAAHAGGLAVQQPHCSYRNYDVIVCDQFPHQFLRLCCAFLVGWIDVNINA